MHPKLFPFRQTHQTVAGLDLGERGLRWVELRQDRLGAEAPVHLERCVFEPLAPGCIVDGEIFEFDEVAAALGRLLAQVRVGSGPLGVTLALAIPDSLVTTQRLQVAPQLNEAERLAHVQLEMALLLRCEAADLCVDFRLSDAGGTLGAELSLSAVASPKVAVEDRIALLEAAGLPMQPAVMSVASQAAVRAASWVAQTRGVSAQAVVALIQLESTVLCLDVIRQGEVLKSHSFNLLSPMPVGADETAVRSNSLRAVVVPAREDGVAGVEVTQSPDSDGIGALDVLDLPAGVMQALEGERAEHIWVAGPAEQASAWAVTLRQRTTLPCDVLDAFDAMRQAESPAMRMNNGPESLVACGLALSVLNSLRTSRSFGSAKRTADPRSLNFLPHRETAWMQGQSFFLKQAGAVALAVLLISAAAQQVLSAQVQTRQNVQAQSARDNAKVEAELKRMVTLAANTSSLQRDVAALRAFMQAPHQMPLLLEELSTLLPDGLHLTGLRRDAQGDAILSGQANSASEVFAFIERLAARSQHFKRPALLDLSLLPAQPASPAVSAPPVSPASVTLPVLVQALPAAPAVVMPASTAPTAGLDGFGRPRTERVMFSIQAYSR